MEIIRNSIAFLCTFYLIYFVISVVLKTIMALSCNNNLTARQERISNICGLVAAFALMPFYYFPC